MSLSPQLPIGVFDSGLGGLTVVRELRRLLPGENIVYLGDTARVPYGARSPATVVRYARSCAALLVDRGIKALVIACNTASAVALDALQKELTVPVVGVIEPGAKAAAAVARQLAVAQQGSLPKIGVLATHSTVDSKAYVRAVALEGSTLQVVQQSAPLLVPLVEEGWLSGDVPRLAVERYLAPLIEGSARVIVLGCTHYPLLKPLIAECAQRMCLGPIRVVDGARVAAQTVEEHLRARGALAEPGGQGQLQLLVSDLPGSFERQAARFLGEEVPAVEVVDIRPV